MTPTARFRGVEDAKRDLLADLNVKTPALAELCDVLEHDFRVEDGGYAQLGDITDEIDRAVASDQIARSARAIIDTLLEARLHLESLEDTIGDGLPLPRANQPEKAARRSTRIDMDLTGFARALGSSLDCLAAVAIGVDRLPYSLQLASISKLDKIPALLTKNRGTAAQRAAWQELHQLLGDHQARAPEGWYTWLLGLRNLNIHRARQVRTMLQRTIEPGDPQLAVVTATPSDVLSTYQFDLHLRRRPHLPDMQELIEVPRGSDLWINEPAGRTLHLVLTCANDLLEDAAALLLTHWRRADGSPKDYPSPTDKWAREPGLGHEFEGLTPGPGNFTAQKTGVGHPQFLKRLELAERLSNRESALPGSR